MLSCKYCHQTFVYELECECLMEKMKEWNQIWIQSQIIDQKIVSITYNITYIYTHLNKNNIDYYFLTNPDGFQLITKDEFLNPTYKMSEYYPFNDLSLDDKIEVFEDTDWCVDGEYVTPPSSFKEEIPYM